MSLLLRGDSEAEKKLHSHYSLIKSLRVRILNFKDRAATMNITDLNLFAWCKCLRHLGKTIMFVVVAGIIGLAAYSTFESALIPGIESGNAGVKFGYILLSILYLTIVSLHSPSTHFTREIRGNKIPFSLCHRSQPLLTIFNFLIF